MNKTINHYIFHVKNASEAERIEQALKMQKTLCNRLAFLAFLNIAAVSFSVTMKKLEQERAEAEK